MSRALLALALLGAYLGVVFGLRTWQHWKATGSSGFQGLSGKPGSAAWLGAVLFALGLLLGVSAPLAELFGFIHPLIHPSHLVALAGAATTLVGMLSTYYAQVAMGEAWRIGVREDEKTDLVLAGPFRWVRNPIFTCMLMTALGLVVLLPNLLSLTSFVSLFVAIELQVRVVEEPYLYRTHGARYADYCYQVGRFVPGLGLRRFSDRAQ